MTRNYEIVILGGGIAGYTAAIRAAQLGMSVAIVERDKLGGTCLHKGCIPSKSLLRSAEVFSTMKNSEQYGVMASSVVLDFHKVQQRKQQIVAQLHQGIEFLMKKNKIEVINGYGRISGPSIFSPRSGVIAVELDDGEVETLIPDHLIIATGSRTRHLSGVTVDGTHVMTSDEALLMEELPQSIIIIGGGIIGVEWASMLNDFGVEVTIVEYSERLLPTEDEGISKELERLFKQRNIKIITNANVMSDSIQVQDGGTSLKLMLNNEPISLKSDKILMSVGRQANVENIGLENTDIELEHGYIKVNNHMQTEVPYIYAVGDVKGGLQLAHVASYEGTAAVEHIARLEVHPLSMQFVPRCVYTRPEIAAVGMTEQQALAQGYETKVGKFSFNAIGKAHVFGEIDGFVKVIADKKTNDILGVHMLGPHVTDYISEAALAQILNATPWEVGQIIHPHPTLAEIMGEAMLAVDGNALGM